MEQTANFTWGQGEDLSVQLIYKEGPEGSETVVDLSSGYELRMDIVDPATKERVYTFNTNALSDADSVVPGDQPDSIIEGSLSSGASGTPNIVISVPRAVTLPGGAAYVKMTLATPVLVFGYDIFLRNTSSDRQAKILTGMITIEGSNTLWA